MHAGPSWARLVGAAPAGGGNWKVDQVRACSKLRSACAPKSQARPALCPPCSQPARRPLPCLFVCFAALTRAPSTWRARRSRSRGCPRAAPAAVGKRRWGAHQPTFRFQHPLTLLCWKHAARPPQTDGQHRWGWKPAGARMTGEIRVWKGRKPARSAPHLLQRDAQRLGAHGILGGAAPLHLLLALLGVAPVG